MVFKEITIIRLRKQVLPDINDQLQMIGGSLGLFSLRDKDKSCFRIFITLLNSVRHAPGLSSDDLATMTGLTRGTVVHHLNKLMSSGIVEHDRGLYSLTFSTIEELISRTTAKDVDARLDLQ